MTLAAVICRHENELICDFAETYHVIDYEALRPSTAAVLLLGLREDSRVKMALQGRRMDAKTTLLAAIADRLSIMIWQKTKDGHEGKNRPKLILEEVEKDDVIIFESADDFEREWAKLAKG